MESQLKLRALQLFDSLIPLIENQLTNMEGGNLSMMERMALAAARPLIPGFIQQFRAQIEHAPEEQLQGILTWLERQILWLRNGA